MGWSFRLTSLLLVACFATAASAATAQTAAITLDGDRGLSTPAPADAAPLGVPLDAFETESETSETEPGRALDAAPDGARGWRARQLTVATPRSGPTSDGGAPPHPIAAHAPRGPPLDA
ncbi:MAG: hypothetical protein VYE22_27825 [Myxococcota bacterium]|nr:hypothetical protein [Myxococcota bacterium]